MASARHEWRAIPLHYVCQLNPSVGFEGLEDGDDVTFLSMDKVKAGYFIPNTEKLSKYAPSYNPFEDGDIVLAKVTPCFENGNIAIAEGLIGGKGFGSSELFVIRPIMVDPKFLFYCLQSPVFKQEGEASMTGAGGLKRVSPDLLRQYRLPFPVASTQRVIADYLDRETAQIDALIAAKQRLLDLIAEKRKALVTQAVTQGLDPNVPKKPSNIPWLGDIPAHWMVCRCANQFREIDERGEPDLPLLVVSIRNGVTRREFSDDKIEGVAADFNTYKVARCGDLVFNKMRMWQGATGIAPEDGLVSPDYVVARLGKRLIPGYIEYLMRIRAFSAECARYSHGITWDRLRLYWEDFKEIRIPLPDRDEQEQIVDGIRKNTMVLGRLAETTAVSIALLTERRAALIAAAVTGQIPIPSKTEP